MNGDGFGGGLYLLQSIGTGLPFLKLLPKLILDDCFAIASI